MSFPDRSGTFGALDLGTTNCRLLVARAVGSDGLRIVDSFSRIVRLGEGLETAGVLSEAAMTRTVAALEVCAAKLAHRNVTAARLVATEACRRAANCGDFVGLVREQTGLELEIIPSGEEARLVLAGCAPLLDPRRRRALVFDIGGGSTEVLWVGVGPRRPAVPSTQILGVISVPHGVVSLTERFVGLDPGRIAFRRMVAEVKDYLAGFDQGLGIRAEIDRGGVQMLGSSGTVTTLAAINLGLPRYDRSMVDGAFLDFAAIREITASLVDTDAAGRAKQPCVGPGRADLMMAGCAILAAICETWPVGRLRVADRGVREGILTGLIEASRQRQRAAQAPVASPVPAPV